MDEISTGLDSSTTFQIVKCIQQIVHLGEATVLASLLQPAPEVFELFDDVMLLSEGQIVYQGPREYVLSSSRGGFRCPQRKGELDFLQEVTSKKDQEQYWIQNEKPYHYVSVPEFVAKFKKFHMGKSLKKQLSVPFHKRKIHKSALVFSEKSVSTLELLKVSWSKEWLLMKRNSFVYIFKIVQRFFAEVHYKPTAISSSSSSSSSIAITAVPIVEICIIIEEPLSQYRRSCAFCPSYQNVLHPKGCRKFVCGNDKDRFEQRLDPCCCTGMGIGKMSFTARPDMSAFLNISPK